MVERQLYVLPGRGWKTPAAGLAAARFGAGEAPIPTFPQRREGAVRRHQQGSSGKLSSYHKTGSWPMGSRDEYLVIVVNAATQLTALEPV